MKWFPQMLITAALVSAVAGTAAAQSTSGILNSLEVQRLVAADTRAAHAILGKHFMAIAEKYRADAVRFNVLPMAPTGNPNHPTPSLTDTRRARQAEAALTLSEAARDMATYHQLRSVGTTPVAPADRAKFDGGFGARVPTAADVRDTVAAARTTADHRALEEYFATVAEGSAADAKKHAAMANIFRVSGQRHGAEFAAMHCDRLANQAREAAKQATASAAFHHQLANIG